MSVLITVFYCDIIKINLFIVQICFTFLYCSNLLRPAGLQLRPAMFKMKVYRAEDLPRSMHTCCLFINNVIYFKVPLIEVDRSLLLIISNVSVSYFNRPK